MAHSILSRVATEVKIPLETLYDQVGWPLATKYSGVCLDAFYAALHDEHAIFKPLELPFQVQAALMKNILHRLQPRPIKVVAKVSLSNFSESGVVGLRRTISKATAAAESYFSQMNEQKDEKKKTKRKTSKETVALTLESPPVFCLSVATTEQQQAVRQIDYFCTYVSVFLLFCCCCW